MLPINKTISMIERFNLVFRNQQFEQYGLHGYQASFLLDIVRNPKLSQDQLKQHMHVDKSTIARGCQHLESLGYISMKKKDEDRRCVELEATKQGHDLAEIIVSILKRQRAYLMQDFNEEDEAQFLVYLQWLLSRATELVDERVNL